MKVKVVGANSVFPWSLGEEISANISHLEDKMHKIMVGEKMYVFEISQTSVVDNSRIVLYGFLTDNTNVGTIGFELFNE